MTSWNFIDGTGQPVMLGGQLGNAGREGAVYRVVGSPKLAAKVYHQPPSIQTIQKLTWMIANPPKGATQPGGDVVLAWPISLFRDGSGSVRGFLMPIVEDSWEISRIIQPSERHNLRTDRGEPFGWHHLHEIARNLAIVANACHIAHYVIGDINNNNTRVSRSGRITLIDTDSFQVSEFVNGTSRLHYCNVVFPDYIPPELAGKSLSSTQRFPSSDCYIIAVLIFRLLQDSAHPFNGKCAEDPPPDPDTLAQRGWFPYAATQVNPRVQPHPAAPTYGRLHPGLRALFEQTFVLGISDPSKRTTAADWNEALATARSSLRRCGRGHYFVAGRAQVCLHRVAVQGGGYCGSSESNLSAKPIPYLDLDLVTGKPRDKSNQRFPASAPFHQIHAPTQPPTQTTSAPRATARGLSKFPLRQLVAILLFCLAVLWAAGFTDGLWEDLRALTSESSQITLERNDHDISEFREGQIVEACGFIDDNTNSIVRNINYTHSFAEPSMSNGWAYGFDCDSVAFRIAGPAILEEETGAVWWPLIPHTETIDGTVYRHMTPSAPQDGTILSPINADKLKIVFGNSPEPIYIEGLFLEALDR